MAEPKVIRGWLGWAVVGDEVYAYAKTVTEAWQCYWTKLGVAEPPDLPHVEEDVEADLEGYELELE